MTRQHTLDESQPLLDQPPPSPSSRPSCPSHVSDNATALFGYALMAFAAITQATRALLFHISETVFYVAPSSALVLSAIIFIAFSAIYCYFSKLLTTTPMSRKLIVQLFFRGLCGAGTLYLNNVALSKIPVGTALTIFSTTPAITSVLAAIVLHDALSVVDVIVLLVNLFGIVLVSQPSSPGADTDALIGVLAAIGAALCAGIGFMILKKMGARIHFMLNMLSIGIGCVLICVCTVDRKHLSMLWNNSTALLIILGGALAGFVSQALVNRGMQICRPGPASVVRTFNVPISFLFGLVFLHEEISHIAVLGAILVVCSVAYIGLSQYLRQRKPKLHAHISPKACHV